jgi:hypothetical protein
MKKIVLCIALFTGFIPTALASVPGATPNDGIDDRAAIQTALNTTCGVQLEPGVYDFDTPVPRLNTQRYDMLQIRKGCSLRGYGPATVLRFRGDGSRMDWHGIGVVGNDVSITDLFIDTSALVNTEEQTHAIAIYGTERPSPTPDDPALHVTVERVWFQHPSRGGVGAPGIPMGGGDCIKVISYAERPSAVHVRGSHFIKCDRSGVSTVGGFHGLLIDSNTFYDTGDQDIDVEANNNGYEMIVTGNVFLLGPVSQGAFAVSLAAPRMERTLFQGNVLNGRGVLIYTSKQSIISDNTIICTKGVDNCIRALKANDDLIIANNFIVRTATAAPAAVVGLSYHSTGLPGSVTVSGNILRNETTRASVLLSNARRLRVIGNTMEWRPPDGTPTASTVLLAISGLAQKIESFVVTGNEFYGPVTHAVELRVASTDIGIGAVTMLGNTAVGPVSGYLCQAPPANPIGPIVSTGNNWRPPVTNTCTVTTGN